MDSGDEAAVAVGSVRSEPIVQLEACCSRQDRAHGVQHSANRIPTPPSISRAFNLMFFGGVCYSIMNEWGIIIHNNVINDALIYYIKMWIVWLWFKHHTHLEAHFGLFGFCHQQRAAPDATTGGGGWGRGAADEPFFDIQWCCPDAKCEIHSRDSFRVALSGEGH